MAIIYLSLGSNVGDTKANLDEAVFQLKKQLEIIQISSYYKTEPVGYKDQEWFLNIVIKATTNFSPYALLNFCQSIERDMKRVKTIRFGPRIIDIDILLYENFHSQEEQLTVPHPRMRERAFVLRPLYEIEPEFILEGEELASIITNLNGEQIRKLEDTSE